MKNIKFMSLDAPTSEEKDIILLVKEIASGELAKIFTQSTLYTVSPLFPSINQAIFRYICDYLESPGFKELLNSAKVKKLDDSTRPFLVSFGIALPFTCILPMFSDWQLRSTGKEFYTNLCQSIDTMKQDISEATAVIYRYNTAIKVPTLYPGFCNVYCKVIENLNKVFLASSDSFIPEINTELTSKRDEYSNMMVACQENFYIAWTLTVHSSGNLRERFILMHTIMNHLYIAAQNMSELADNYLWCDASELGLHKDIQELDEMIELFAKELKRLEIERTKVDYTMVITLVVKIKLLASYLQKYGMPSLEYFEFPEDKW